MESLSQWFFSTPVLSSWKFEMSVCRISMRQVTRRIIEIYYRNKLSIRTILKVVSELLEFSLCALWFKSALGCIHLKNVKLHWTNLIAVSHSSYVFIQSVEFNSCAKLEYCLKHLRKKLCFHPMCLREWNHFLGN